MQPPLILSQQGLQAGCQTVLGGRSGEMDTVNSLPSVIVREHYDYLAKIIVIGPSSTGKTSLLHRYITNELDQHSISQTIGVDFKSKICCTSDDVRIKLQLWDTAGQERFRSLTRSYYRNSAGVIMVFDLADLSTLASLDEYWQDVRELMHSPSVVLVGNKGDLAQGLSAQDVEAIWTRWGVNDENKEKIQYVETSVKDGTNVSKPFELLAESLWKRLQYEEIDPDDSQFGVQYGDIPWNVTLQSFKGARSKLHRQSSISLDQFQTGVEQNRSDGGCWC